MAYTTTQIKHLNKMNRASQDVQLGTMLGNLITTGSLTTGSWSVTGTQASASAITIQTTVKSISGKIVEGFRSGSPLTMKTTVTGSNLNITSASPTYWVIAAADEINYIVW
jgi:hypothetical protein